MSIKLSMRGIKRLEIAMRDVMDGLEDAANYMNYHSSPNIVEILSIEPADRIMPSESKVIPLKSSTSDIVEYITQRELKRTA